MSAAMSAPAYTCHPDRLGGDVLLDMLDRGFRHFPVVSATGRVLGVVEEIDLVAAQTRSSFFLRRRIARAESSMSSPTRRASCARWSIALHDARVAPVNVAAVYSVVVDALTRRLLELAVARARDPGRRVRVACAGQPGAARGAAQLRRRQRDRVVRRGRAGRGTDRGCTRSAQTVVAAPRGAADCAPTSTARPRPTSGSSARSIPGSAPSRSWIADPTQEKALILVSVLVDSRPVWGVHTGTPVADSFRLAPSNPALLRLLARFALSHRPPTGFFRGLVVEHTGEHRGRLDLKHGGVIPIVDLARWAGIAAGRDERVDDRAAARGRRRPGPCRGPGANARGRATR